MTYTDASSILSTSKTCNRLDQFLRLVKGDVCARNPLIFSSHRVRSSYSLRSTRSAGHVGWDDEIIEKCRAQLAETAEARTTAHKM